MISVATARGIITVTPTAVPRRSAYRPSVSSLTAGVPARGRSRWTALDRSAAALLFSVDRPNKTPGSLHEIGAAIPRRQAPNETADQILDAARRCLLESGYPALSTRAIAEEAGVPLSQIHYHFGSKRQLVLALLDGENVRRLERQATMYDADQPLWKQWEQACDFLEEDLDSGYVRVLQEMTAAGWSDDRVGAAVRDDLRGWFRLLTRVTERFGAATGSLGPFEAVEVATLVGVAFLGCESLILLGFGEDELPVRGALRRVGALIRSAEEGSDERGR